MRRAQRAAQIAGFTLVEALVALLLMGVIMAALATITAQWLPSWNRGFARVQNAEHLSLVLDRLAGDLAAAEFVTLNRRSPRALFEGAELGVMFVRSAIGPNARGGLDVDAVFGDTLSELLQRWGSLCPADDHSQMGELPGQSTGLARALCRPAKGNDADHLLGRVDLVGGYAGWLIAFLARRASSADKDHSHRGGEP